MKEFTVTAADGLVLSGAFFGAESPKAVVQIIHGLREHKEIYYDFAEFLLEKGYSSVITDLRGHGQSVNARYFLGHFDGTEQLVEDQALITEYIKENCPGTDIYMLGHSLGSVIARLYLKDRDFEIKKLVTTGTFAPLNAAGAYKAICSLSKNIHHSNTVKGLLPAVMNGARDERLFANYTAAVEFRADPLSQGCKYTNGAVYTVFEADYLMKKSPIHICGNPGLRILIANGGDDAYTGGAGGINNTLKYLRRDGYSSIFTVSYPGMRHTLLKEMNKEEVFKDIAMFFSD